MAKLPYIQMRKRLQEGGTAAEDLPIQQGGTGTFPMTSASNDDNQDLVGKQAIPPEQKIGLTTGEKVVSQPLTAGTNEFLTTTGTDLGTAPTITPAQAVETDLTIATPTVEAAQEYTAYMKDDNLPQAVAAQGALHNQAIIGNVEKAVSDKSQADIVQGTVSQEATVKYQMSELLKTIGTDGEMPSWASPAVRAVNAQMLQRGLGASSMAATAMINAIYEAGLPIAAADAKTHAAMDIQNLTNRQTTTLQNAMTYAAMDKTNAAANLQAQIQNAKSFLGMDLVNLDNEQKTNLVDFEAGHQKLLSDTGQENAARQFNAKSVNQRNEFATEIGSQISNANSTRLAAMRQFNSDQTNATERFVAQMEDSRDKFNANMVAQIDQSNANWRRTINTENTALANESNRINAQNLLGLTTTAQNQLWQRYRDEAQWALTVGENALSRAHAFAIASQQNNFSKDQYQQEVHDTMMSELGSSIIRWLFT